MSVNSRSAASKRLSRSADVAAVALAQCEDWHAKLHARLGVGFVYASDELYVLAGRGDVPDAGWYDGFPVLTNGVGLLRNMLDDWRRLIDRLPSPTRQSRKVAWVTGGLAGPALERMADAWLTHAGWRPEVTPELKAELERRVAAHEADPGRVLTWDQVVAHVKRPR